MMYNDRMNVTTREKILETIGHSSPATVAELSRQLHTTVANIRYHLEPLLASQIVEALPPDQKSPQRGRPAARYRLAVRSRPTDLARLTSDLLRVLLDPAQTPEKTLESLEQIARLRCATANLHGAPTQRLTQAVEFLNGHAYQARWEARRGGPEIRLGNCPFASIVAEHPELCQIDSLMLANLLNARVAIHECYQPDKGLPATCIFLIQSIQR